MERFKQSDEEINIVCLSDPITILTTPLADVVLQFYSNNEPHIHLTNIKKVSADAITYARKYKPRLVVDVATLTGAALTALGQRASAVMTKDKRLENLFLKIAEERGDYMWPLPLWAEYE